MKKAKYFNETEMACRCGCGGNLCVDVLMDALDELRENVSAPITITSGYRCVDHNKAVGGEPNSQHVRGMAADIRIKGMTPQQMYLAARYVKRFGGFGVGNNFLHVDVRTTFARWCYGPNGKQIPWNLGDAFEPKGMVPSVPVQVT